ncbi:transmembrane protease serine 9-like [Galleria mellonella]|uniref:Transmembrane protease serine 9-like n=1 Tax=Galleria mellonella TaxID=7137 RepID=A0A6J3C8E5_GALME|nr:transmembrane protease serine 9-like [Galleria mellonella]
MCSHKMHLAAFILTLAVSVGAAPKNPQRIVGGSVTTIGQYPEMASMLINWSGSIFSQACGGSIINARSILSAAHCFFGDVASRWRVRVGSIHANSGGVVHELNLIILHENYITSTLDNDIAILRTSTYIVYNNIVRPAVIAGTAYNLYDNSVVWAVGWGSTSVGGTLSEELRHVQIWSINQATCRNIYSEIGLTVTDNMLCSGWLDVGGRDQCQGDSGGPLFHDRVVVGICSLGHQCALARYPGVNTRVSRYTRWIQANALFKMRIILVLYLIGVAAVVAVPRNPQRIVGGAVTDISRYPEITSLLYSWNGVIFSQACGGTILNQRSILSAAHCFVGDLVSRWRIRVGSSYANSGGIIHGVSNIVLHQKYNIVTQDNDIAILHTVYNIVYNNFVKAASILGPNFNLGYNEEVWAAGWGAVAYNGPPSEQLRHVLVWTVNHTECADRYREVKLDVTPNMLCSGWLDVGGRDQCQGDSGGPLYYNGVVVGIASWGLDCGNPYFPGVNTRVSNYFYWISINII